MTKRCSILLISCAIIMDSLIISGTIATIDGAGKQRSLVKNEPFEIEEQKPMAMNGGATALKALNRPIKKEQIGEVKTEEGTCSFDQKPRRMMGNQSDQNDDVDQADTSEQRSVKHSAFDGHNACHLISDQNLHSTKRKRRRFNSAEMKAIIEKFDKIKEAIKGKGRKFWNEEWISIETGIAHKLDTSRRTIYKWKRDLGMPKRNNKTDNSKRLKIVKQFERLKRKMVKLKAFPSEQMEAQVVHKFGYSAKTIRRWARELGLTQPKKFKEAEKVQILKAHNEIKRAHPRMRLVDIAKVLGIGARTLFAWRHQFGRETAAAEEPHRAPSPGDSVWLWNLATRQRSGGTD